MTFLSTAYYATMFIAFTNISTNPFIYGAKHDDVRRVLGRWFRLRKLGEVTPEAVVTVSLSQRVTRRYEEQHGARVDSRTH